MWRFASVFCQFKYQSGTLFGHILERFQVATFSQMIQTKCIAKCAVHRAICKAQKHKVVKDAGELSIAPPAKKNKYRNLTHGQDQMFGGGFIREKIAQWPRSHPTGKWLGWIRP